MSALLGIDGIEPVCAQILRDAGHTVVEKSKLPASELLSIIGDFDGLIVRSETKVTVRVLNSGGSFRAHLQPPVAWAGYSPPLFGCLHCYSI